MLKLKKSTNSGLNYQYVPETLTQMCVPISDLKPWSKNPRKNDDAAKKLADLIKKHGFRKPIVVDQYNTIRAGNTAYKAAKILGMKYIPVAKSTFKSEVAATAYGISDNKASEFALWDDNLLSELMQVEELRNDTKQTGFSEKELALFDSGYNISGVRGLGEGQKKWAAIIKIEKITPEDADYIFGLVTEALKGTGYEAKIAK